MRTWIEIRQERHTLGNDNTWLNRDKALAEGEGSNPDIWWDHVEKYSNRAEWAITENRNYSRNIIFKHQPMYSAWGDFSICTD